MYINNIFKIFVMLLGYFVEGESSCPQIYVASIVKWMKSYYKKQTVEMLILTWRNARDKYI